MGKEVKIGQQDYSVLVFIPDPASTDGSGKTGLNAAALTVSGVRVETDNDVTVTDYTSSLNDLSALTDAHNDWGVKEVSSTLAPGLYRLDIADAIFLAGAWQAVVYVMVTTSAAAASPIEFTLVPENPYVGVNVSMISNDADAADNCELMFDGTGYAGGTAKLTVDLNKIFGTALSETGAGYLAAAFKKFFDKQTPTGTINSLPDAVAGANGGLPTTNGTKVSQTVDLTAGQSIAVSDKTGFSLSSTGADLILKSSTFIQAIVAAINEFATYGLTALNTLLVTTGIKTASTAAPTDMALESTLTSIKGGTWSGTTDTLEAIRDKLPTNLEDLNITDTTGLVRPDMANASGNYSGTVATVTNLTNAPTAGDFTATMKASVTAAVPTAAAIGTDAAGKVLVTPAQKIITDINGYVTYSNTAPPTTAAIKTALEVDGGKLDHLWEMTEDDAGTRRLTTNALEQAPSGTGATAEEVRIEMDANSTQLAAIKAKTDTIGGAGAVAWNYTVTDANTGLPIDGVEVWITTDLVGTNVIATGLTNTFGVASFTLDAGTIYVWCKKSGYDFTNPDVESVVT